MCLLTHDSILRVAGKCNLVHHAESHDDVASTRLPQHISPEKYSLTIASNLEDWTFQGYVSIHLDVKEPTRFINFHALEMVFRTVDLYAGYLESNIHTREKITRPAPVTSIKDVFLFEENQRALIELTEEIPVGQYTLDITYSGDINDHLAGLYRGTYTDEDNVTHRVACTQFEATDARRCLPCWDEPAFKSVFECVLINEARYTTLANGEEVRRVILEDDVNDGIYGLPSSTTSTIAMKKPTPCPELDAANIAHPTPLPKGYSVTTFKTTPVMSTYLLAFVIGEFDYLEDVTKHGIVVRVYAPPGKKEQGRFALNTAVKCFAYFEELFGISYRSMGFSHSYLLSVPSFAAGAMENYGLILFRTTALLVTENTTTASLRSTARIICHEIAHQWFGNYATMSWWNDLFLNEAFARLSEFLGCNHIFPEWNIYELFAADPYNLALDRDSTKSSHPIEQRADTPDEINAMFDAISYAKGAAVLHNLHTHLGESFIHGVSAYLKHFAFRNAQSEDLWNFLEKTWKTEIPDRFTNPSVALNWQTGEPSVNTIVHPWTREMNYPVVFVTDKGVNEAGQRVYELQQKPVTAVSITSDPEDKEDTRLWAILLHAGTLSGSYSKSLYFNTETLTFTCDTTEDIIFNNNGTCLTHVIYKSAIPKTLQDAVGDKSMNVINRLCFINDIAFGFKTGLYTYTDFITVLQKCSNETQLYVLATIEATVTELLTVHRSSDILPTLQEHLSSIFEPLFIQLNGWDYSDKSMNPIRTIITRMMLKLKNARVLTDGLPLAEALIQANEACIQSYISRYGMDGVCGCGSCTCYPCKCEIPEYTATIPTSDVLTPFFTYNGLPADIQANVLSIIANYSNQYKVGDTYTPAATILKAFFVATTDIETKLKVASTLSTMGSKAVLENVVKFVDSEQCIRMQDAPYVFRTILTGTELGHSVAWKYIHNNWKTMLPRIRSGNVVALTPFLYSIMQRVTEPGLVQQLTTFFKDNFVQEGADGINRGFEAMKHNQIIFKYQNEQIKEYYKNK